METSIDGTCPSCWGRACASRLLCLLLTWLVLPGCGSEATRDGSPRAKEPTYKEPREWGTEDWAGQWHLRIDAEYKDAVEETCRTTAQALRDEGVATTDAEQEALYMELLDQRLDVRWRIHLKRDGSFFMVCSPAQGEALVGTWSARGKELKLTDVRPQWGETRGARELVPFSLTFTLGDGGFCAEYGRGGVPFCFIRVPSAAGTK